MKKKICFAFLILTLILTSCRSTVDLESTVNYEFDETFETLEQEEEANSKELEAYIIEESLKVQDVEDTVIYIERPVYRPEQKSESSLEKKDVSGKQAVQESQKSSVIKPQNYKDGCFVYQFNENFVYEIYAQPYHLTDISLEPGEVVTATPLISEDESVWELTAGVGRDSITGLDVQHLFIKPAYSKQDSTMIIITDRRVYHFRILSYADTHMAMVRFTYPNTKNVWAKNNSNSSQGRSAETNFVHVTNPELLSFDYKIKYSRIKKPEFLPKRVYDDGMQTYIQVDDIVLQKKLPLCFNEKNEIINYVVKDNVFIIPRLIDKVTLRLGKEKVTIEKKIYKEK